jgi:Fur family zinc uptake transcriptional regulator
MAHSHDIPTDLTRNQELVLGALTGSTGPLSAYDILDRLRGDGLRAPLQVYRALEKLVDRGLAHRLESLNAFVACADTHCHRKGLIAFAVSSSSCLLQAVGAWARTEGFKVERTTMEIRGRCADCLQKAA